MATSRKSSSKDKKKKPKAEELVLSAPTGFKSGIQAKVDMSTGEIKGLPTEYKAVTDALGSASSLSVAAGTDTSQLPEVLRPQNLQHILQEDAARRKKEEEKKLANQPTPLSITGPLKVMHKLHVDADLNWSEASSDSLKLLKKLGEGAYGCVYKAKHRATEQIIAIKTVLVGSENEGAAEIKKEIDILRQCRHPNIVCLYGCTEKARELWVMMDFCAVGSVKDYMKKSGQTLTENQVAAVLHYVCEGLEYLHQAKIVHRDLKSANILINDVGDIKIADFGVSLRVSDHTNKNNAVLGTPLFMSPEALNGQDAGSKADIWSLGITAIEMIDGNPPYHEEHVMRAMLLIASAPAPKLKHPEKYTPAFNAFIARCLNKEATLRPTAAELLTDPFIEGKDHKLEMQQLIAEIKIMNLQDGGGGEEVDERILAQQQEERERNDREQDDDDSSLAMSADGTHTEGKKLTKSSSQKEMKPKKQPPPKRNLAPVSKLRLTSDSRLSPRDDMVVSKQQRPPSARGEGLSANDALALQTMEELLLVMQDKLAVEKQAVAEFHTYSQMSFQQLVNEIVEMRKTAAALEKKLGKR